MNENISIPSVMSMEYSLPFSELEPRRFEVLCLRVAVRKYGLITPEHIGYSGTDGGADILGQLNQDGKNVDVAIQCKRYKEISPRLLIHALETFREHRPDFIGQFWIMTSASVSQTARSQFLKSVHENKLAALIVDGSAIEDAVRCFPLLMQEFFSAAPTALSKSIHETALKLIQRIQRFEDEFLDERDRSFGGDFAAVSERQKVMGGILNEAMIELRSLATLIFENFDGIETACLAATRVINNYKTANQTTADGLPFSGSQASLKAFVEEPNIRSQFQKACQNLRTLAKGYL